MQLFKNIIDRAKGIILNPRFEWELIESETVSISDIYKYYIIPLAAIGPIASVLGASYVGFNIPFVGHYYVPLAYSALGATVCYVLSLVGVYLIALIINYAAKWLDGEADFVQAFKLASYSSTPVWILGVFNLIQSLRSISLLGLFYTVYLLYLGLPVLMRSSPEKRVPYVLVVGLFFLLVYLVISFFESLFVVIFSPQVVDVAYTLGE